MKDWNKLEDIQLSEIIGKSVKGRRLLKNISQDELAELSGVSRPSIIRFETGKGNISLMNLISILKALDIANELKVIFKGIEESPALLSKATSKKTQERVRWSKKAKVEEDETWEWEEDKK